MSDQPTTEELRAAFGLTSDGGLTPEAVMEVKRRQDNLQDQIARDVFAVLYDKEFAKCWFDTHAADNGSRGFHYNEVCRAARAASDIALHATGQIMHEDDELDARQNLLRKFIAELEDAEDE
jgi:hypothetical protein